MPRARMRHVALAHTDSRGSARELHTLNEAPGVSAVAIVRHLLDGIRIRVLRVSIRGFSLECGGSLRVVRVLEPFGDGVVVAANHRSQGFLGDGVGDFVAEGEGAMHPAM